MKLCRSARKRNFGLKMGRLLRRLRLRSRVFSSVFWRPYKKPGFPIGAPAIEAGEPQTASFPRKTRKYGFPLFFATVFLYNIVTSTKKEQVAKYVWCNIGRYCRLEI